MDSRSLRPSQFYNKNIDSFEIISMTKAKQNASRHKHELEVMPQRLMGPTQFRQHFRKQADALDCMRMCSTETETLCTFVRQKEDGYREFIVAHPEVYWWYNVMSVEQSCSYEVIPEGAPCWLYFDLEYQKDLNPEKDGPGMTTTLMKIFCAYLMKYYQLTCDEKNVVNLDSTTDTKFSRHLIFCIKDIAFRDNSHVGRLVKGVCAEIEDYLENSAALHDVLSHFERKDLEDLLVTTAKGKKIFVDTGVYTRNRHFRTYKSTKWGKNANLLVAPGSQYEPLEERTDKLLGIFLDSLISYFPNKKDLVLLEMDENEEVSSRKFNRTQTQSTSYNNSSTSSYPLLDKFILSLVVPGKIRLCIERENTIVYDIIGHRYCANIGRQHKSNNIYWVANLQRKQVYQKCHDEDCADFVSKPVAIPEEVAFHLSDEFDEVLLSIPDEHEL